MSIEYSAAAVWPPHRTIDADAAMDSARSLLEEFDRERRSQDVPGVLDSAVAALGSTVADVDDDEAVMTEEVYSRFGLCWPALTVHMILGGGDDQFEVASDGVIVAFGADERGAHSDRSSVRRLSLTLTDPNFEVFRAVLLAGGAVPPSMWRLERF